MKQQKTSSSWAIVALIFVLIVIGISALGLYSLFSSAEVKTATAVAIEHISDGLFVLLTAFAAAVILCAVGWAIGRGGPAVDRGVTQRHFINALEQSGGRLQLPQGETWEIYTTTVAENTDKLLHGTEPIERLTNIAEKRGEDHVSYRTGSTEDALRHNRRQR